MKYKYGTFNNYKATLMVYVDIGKKMLKDIGIETGEIVKYEVGTPYDTWGLTTDYGENKYCISISHILIDLMYEGKFIKKDKNQCQGLLNTVIHELLHTCKNSMDHGKEWKTNAQKVYERYGIIITEKNNYRDKGIAEDTYLESYKYIIKCSKCGMLYGDMTKANCILNPNDYCCSSCGNEKLIRIK